MRSFQIILFFALLAAGCRSMKTVEPETLQSLESASAVVLKNGSTISFGSGCTVLRLNRVVMGKSGGKYAVIEENKISMLFTMDGPAVEVVAIKNDTNLRVSKLYLIDGKTVRFDDPGGRYRENVPVVQGLDDLENSVRMPLEEVKKFQPGETNALPGIMVLAAGISLIFVVGFLVFAFFGPSVP